MADKIRLGILGTADIAFRRFLPALLRNDKFQYIGVASRTIEKTKVFINEFGGNGYGSYEELLNDPKINAVYIPLPPSLHFEWASKALEKGKHVLIEKPFTTSLEDANRLLQLAQSKKLAVFENYMFAYHAQLKVIRKMIEEREVGDIRTYKISFGFPMRAIDDFRYNKNLGGGALLDCGGYTIKLASILLGSSAKVVYSKLNYVPSIDVDLFGSAILENDEEITAQVSFGMDNSYQCGLEIWGSKSTIIATRIFTAGVGFKPELLIKTSMNSRTIELPEDDQFLNSIDTFYKCIIEPQYREDVIQEIKQQSTNMEQVRSENRRNK